MDRLKMHTLNKTDENYKKISAMFPNAITETINENGEVVRAIDVDVLQQEISEAVVAGGMERYQFTWPDKKKSIILANKPINKTLRLDREKSVGRDGTPGSIDTENIYIEGDNLDVLKLLQETYLGKVNMIYIDPPYNTGNNFIYEDDFSQSTEAYLDNSGQADEYGNRLVANLESNGRFHTDWLNMLYPRLKVSRDLLTDDGLVFISIDDNELGNLRKICDEVFGRDKFLGCITWTKKTKPINSGNAKYQLQARIEYVLVYCKNQNAGNTYKFILASKGHRTYTYETNKGYCRLKDIEDSDFGTKARDTLKFSILGVSPSSGRRWKIGYDEVQRLIAEDKITIIDGKVKVLVYPEDESGDVLEPFWSYIGDKVGTAEKGKKDLNDLMGVNVGFDTVKPVDLITEILKHVNPNALVVDFFSGSATTAHACFEQNINDGGNRRFIMVQIQENCDEFTDAFKAGYPTICDIGEERIRRAGKKIKEEHPDVNLDIGFRVFKVDSSNMKDVYYNPDSYVQEQIDLFADNIKEDRTPEDLLFQVMLDLGISLSSKIDESVINDKKVFIVGGEYTALDGSNRTHLIACFDKDITDDTVQAIAEKHPSYAVFRDSCMANDCVATNFEQIFETYSPNTVRKVL